MMGLSDLEILQAEKIANKVSEKIINEVSKHFVSKRQLLFYCLTVLIGILIFIINNPHIINIFKKGTV